MVSRGCKPELLQKGLSRQRFGRSWGRCAAKHFANRKQRGETIILPVLGNHDDNLGFMVFFKSTASNYIYFCI